MKTKFLIILSVILLVSCKQNSQAMPSAKTENLSTQPAEESQQKIQVALLLDTSNSMDGLIEQAKSRLWNIVNTLTTLKYDGKSPDIEIALYEYGNDNISSETDWVRQIVPLTKDLDEISEKLFTVLIFNCLKISLPLRAKFFLPI